MIADSDAERCDFGLGRLKLTDAVEDDVGALCGQGKRDAVTDAAGGAGDDGGFAFKDEFNSCRRVW